MASSLFSAMSCRARLMRARRSSTEIGNPSDFRDCRFAMDCGEDTVSADMMVGGGRGWVSRGQEGGPRRRGGEYSAVLKKSSARDHVSPVNVYPTTLSH